MKTECGYRVDPGAGSSTVLPGRHLISHGHEKGDLVLGGGDRGSEEQRDHMGAAGPRGLRSVCEPGARSQALHDVPSVPAFSAPAWSEEEDPAERVLLNAGLTSLGPCQIIPGEGGITQEKALDIPLIPTFHVIFLKFLLVRAHAL